MRRFWLYRGLVIVIIVAALLALGGGEYAAPRLALAQGGSYQFSGHVYEGYRADTAAPLLGVSVGLWGDMDEWPESGFARVALAGAVSDAAGVFTLAWTTGGVSYPYLHLIETDPPAMASSGAEAGRPGQVKTLNCVTYQLRLLEADTLYAGSAFWDIRQPEAPTATTTPTSGPTDTPTPCCWPTKAPTPTPTAALECPAALRIEKTLLAPADGAIHVGDTLTFQIVVTNLGPGAALYAQVEDFLPAAHLEFLAAQPPPHALSAATMWGSVVTALRWEWPLGLAAGQSVVLTVQARARQAGGDPDWLGNSAVGLLRDGCAQVSMGNADLALLIRERPASLRLYKTLLEPAGGELEIGETARFRLRVENSGGQAAAFALEDRFDAGCWEFVSASLPPSANLSDQGARLLVWEELSLSGGAALEIELQLRARAGCGILENCARLRLYLAGGQNWNLSAPSCAMSTLRGREAKALAASVQFLNPPNHLARFGEPLSWRVTLTNQGAEPVAGWTLRNHSSALGCLAVERWLDHGPDSREPWPLAPGESATLDFYSEEWHSSDLCTLLLNQADWTVYWADGSPSDGAPSFVSAHDYLVVNFLPESKRLAVKKELLSPAAPQVGDTLTFRVTIANQEMVTVAVAPLLDLFDAPCLSFERASIAPTRVLTDTAQSVLIWENLGPLAPGESASVLIYLRAEQPCAQTSNCVSASDQEQGARLGLSNDCLTLDIAGAQPQIVVSKTLLSAPFAQFGEMIEYAVRVRNAGDAPAPSVALRDQFDPQALEFAEASPAPDALDALAGQIAWDEIGPLAPGEERVFNVRLRARRPGAYLANCAEVVYALGQRSVTRRACADVNIGEAQAAARLYQERVWPPEGAPLAVGDAVAYHLRAYNTGHVTLAPLYVLDIYNPDCLELLFAGPPLDSASAQGQLAWLSPQLEVGSMAEWWVWFRVRRECGETANCAQLVAAGPQQETVMDGLCLTEWLAAPEPGLRVVKQARLERAPEVGDVLRYEVSVANSGNTTLLNVALEDSYDIGCADFVAASPAPDALDAAGTMEWRNLGPLQPGEARTVNVYLRVKALCQYLGNCASASAEDVLWQRAEGSDCAAVVVGRAPRRVELPLILRGR